MTSTHFTKILSVFCVVASAMVVQAQSATITVSGPGAIVKSKPFTLKVQIKTPDGYHIYGAKEKVGVPTTFAITSPKGFKIKATYPKPTIFRGLDGPQEVYSGTTAFPISVTAPKGAKGKHIIKLKVSFMMCNDHTCLPRTSADVSMTVNLK